MTVPELSLGSYGRKVTLLQQQLNLRGYKVAPSEVARSLFGPSTRAALERWQREHGLTATGALDDRTSAVLTAATLRNGPSPRSSTAGTQVDAPPHFRSAAKFAGRQSKALEISTPKADTAAVCSDCIVITSPPDGSLFVASDKTGYTVTVRGLYNGDLSYISAILWIIDDIYPPHVITTLPSSNTWSVQILVPLGIHQLVIVADSSFVAATAGVIRITVVSQTDIFDVAPESYLRSLTEFATAPFTSAGTARIAIDSPGTQSLTKDLIDSTFHQSIRDLLDRNNASKSKERVHQVRICIEVLRQYLASLQPTPALPAAESTYRQAVYFSLLNQIGTTYDAIRLARTYDRNAPNDQKKLQAIADRLGIEIGTRSSSNTFDHVDQLCFDPSGDSSSVPALTEQALEQTFGLVDTARDPLSQGATISDTQNFIVRWNLVGVEWNRTTDIDGITYLTVTLEATQQNGGGDSGGGGKQFPELPRHWPPGGNGGNWQWLGLVTVYKDSARTIPVATGSIPVFDNSLLGGTAVLEPVGTSGLSGQILFTEQNIGVTTLVFPYNAALSVFPRFLSWQFQRLRNTWLAEDFPADTVLTFQLMVTDSNGATASATTDVTVCHLSRPFTLSAGPNQTIVEGSSVTLTCLVKDANPQATFTYQWSQLSGPPVALQSRTNAVSLIFRAPLVPGDTPLTFVVRATDNTGTSSSAIVDVTVYHIDHPLSVMASDNQTVNQGAAVSLTSNATPANLVAGYQWDQTEGPTVLANSNNPANFTAPTVTDDTLLTFRLTVMDTLGGSTAVTVHVTVYASSRPLTVNAGATQTVNEGDTVTLAGHANDSNAAATIVAYQWTQIAGPVVVLTGSGAANCSFVAPAVGQDTVLTFQLTVTDSVGLTASATVDVSVFHIRNPLTVSAGASQAVGEAASVVLTGYASDSNSQANISNYRWTQIAGPAVALLNANTPTATFVAPSTPPVPIIDPDLLIPGDFKHRDESPFIDLYTGRQAQIQGQFLTPLQTEPRSLVGLNNMLASVLGGNQLSYLQSLETQRQAGQDITPELRAIKLTEDAFDYLLRIGTFLQGGQTLLGSEWDELYSILVQVQKLQNFPAWRALEFTRQITVSPDYFNFPTVFPEIFSTGLDSHGASLPELAPDPHWTIIAAPGSANSAPAYTPANTGSWMHNTAASGWISPQTEALIGDAPGLYTYRTTIDLSGYDPASARLTVKVAVVDDLTAVRLSGRDLGLTTSGSAGFATFEINGPYQPGINTLDFVVNNATYKASGLRVEVYHSVPPRLSALLPWRAQIQARNDWQDRLQGRTEQNNSLIYALQAGIDLTEAATLPLLRDGLVQATPYGSEWLTQRLLIDTQGAADSKTTRLEQATETMQALFFALRNNEFQQLSPQPDVARWSLTERLDQFDDEWVWMATYSQWRSVMLVFLYPENTLLPTVRLSSDSPTEPTSIVERTKAFGDLAKRLQTDRQLTSADALKLAQQYLSDLNDTTLYPNVPNVVVTNYRYEDPTTINLLSQLRTNSQQALTNSPSPTATAYMWEAWYFVPVQIALELQKAGQFEAALDWFRTVYAYDLPLIRASSTNSRWSDESRKTFYGLAIESSTSHFFQVPTWTIDFSNPHQIATTRAYPYSRFTVLSIVECLLDFADAQFATEGAELTSNARALYLSALDLVSALPQLLPADPVVGSNPRLAAFWQHAVTNLSKLRSGRNIAGMVSPVDGAFIQPTAYRYSVLIDKAKQLVSLAQQVEGSYLVSLQRQDDEAYTALRAQQDFETAKATVILQRLKAQQAADGITLAQDQKFRVTTQANHYQDLIDKGLSDHEKEALGEQLDQFRFGIGASIGGGLTAGLSAGAAGATVGSIVPGVGTAVGAAVGFAIGVVGSIFSGLSTGSGQHAQFSAMEASYERRAQEWQFQLDLAKQDETIAKDQIDIAYDQQNIATQEVTIAITQVDHAQATIDFLAQKFTNADLYRWMSGILGRVYAYFLQQATAIARLAERQLAFERQQKPPSIIQSNYWQPLRAGNGGAGSGDQNASSRGLTAAEQLLQDITDLDQYAFETNRVKLQVTKIISLSRLDPFVFQQFRDTGVLRVATPIDLFDRDFPGQYLRTIARVRVSVIALIPPSQGIRATLSNHGISRVVTAGELGTFQPVVVRRDPQLVAFSTAMNATGLFDLSDSQPGMLSPFEGLGVDTNWEFMMAPAANPFDYATISDVLLTLDYTALDSVDYRQEVLQELDRSAGGDRAYSFRQQFADAWYDLNNPDQSSSPMVIQFQTRPEDFPPNVQNIIIQQLVMYFVPANGVTLAVQPTATLTLLGADSNANPEWVKGTAVAIEDVISTRRGNGPSPAERRAHGWSRMIGMRAVGVWTLDLSKPDLRNLFESGQLEDILFVITYSGQVPAWPA